MASVRFRLGLCVATAAIVAGCSSANDHAPDLPEAAAQSGIPFFVGTAVIGLLGGASLMAGLKFRRQAPILLAKTPATGTPLANVSVIIPCKGDDGRLLENLSTLVRQEYPCTAEFILITAREDDPAQDVFLRLAARHPEIRVKRVVAGISATGSEKCNNLIKAVAASDPKSEVLVFFDSDGKADPELLRKLVSGLINSGAAAVSGMRWYQPKWHRIPEVIRSAWNAGCFPSIAEPKMTYLWGGAMAISRRVYDKANVSDLWAISLADDAALRPHLEKHGLRTLFLPNCIVVSSERDTWSTLIEFLARQHVMLRLQFKSLFWMFFAMYVTGNVIGFAFLIRGFSKGIAGTGLTAGLVGLCWISHYWLFGLLIIRPIRQLLTASGRDCRIRGTLIVVAPLVGLISTTVNLYCAFARRVTWSGVTYEMKNGVAIRVT